MCGIAGIFNTDKSAVSLAHIKDMTDELAHRGPDGEGHYVAGDIALGHRRLAIIDLSDAARQPMSNEDDSIILTFNGEIYNYRELRKELEKKGHYFKSGTDAEVILHGYEEEGPHYVKRLNGMFALAVYDHNRQELFLARDRYGIKPLYYAFIGNTLVFASENKAILKYPHFDREMDLEALLEYFTFQNIFTHRTLIKGISLFPAACWAKIRCGSESSSLDLFQYWDYKFIESCDEISDLEYQEELDRLFKQAVNRQLVSDVEIGAYLSGGMDSGSITAIAANKFPYIKSFTCGFDLNSASGMELGFDERQNAEYMSYLFKTEHYEMVLKAGDMERAFDRLAWHLEEPRVGQSYPNYYMAQLASKFVKVVLAGTGGDELFGGYPWRYYKAVVNDDFEHYIDKYYSYWQRLIPNRVIGEVFSPIWKDVKHVWTRDIFRDVFHKHSSRLTTPEDYVNHSLYFEAKTFLQGLLLVEDKLAMAHGLEARVPFLDNDLVDFALRIPVRLKLRDLTSAISIDENEQASKKIKYYRRTNDGKLIIRKVMEKYIPGEVTDAIKKGFSAPDASWFRGESIDYVKRVLFNDSAKIYRYMDRSAVRSLLNEHMSGEHNRRLLIWSLLNFEHWCELYLS